MVRNDAIRHLVLPFIRVFRDLLGRADDRQEQISVKIGLAALDQRYETLQAHAGIDVFLRQLFVLLPRQIRLAVIL